MKIFEMPSAEIEEIRIEDVITTSGDDVCDGYEECKREF